jgi:uncharacterized protein (DUF4415 family)
VLKEGDTMPTVKKSRNDLSISKERLAKLKARKDEDIDYSDIPELDETFWKNAEVRLPETKTAVYIRLDGDVLDWLKSQGKGYQTRINAILRSYYEAHRDDAPH